MIDLNLINGCENITGGGIYDNIQRIIPEGLCANIDLNKINYYKTEKYWEEIIPEENYFIVEKNEFYILRSKESIIIRNNQAAELEPFKDSFGNFRVHYAGFFDPGFGNNKMLTC